MQLFNTSLNRKKIIGSLWFELESSIVLIFRMLIRSKVQRYKGLRESKGGENLIY